MTDVATLLAEFVDALHAGASPDVGAYIARAETEQQRMELAVGIETALDFVPDEVRHPRAADGSFVLAVPPERIAEAARVTWPKALPFWRGRSDLTVPALAAATLRAGGLADDAESVAAAGRWIQAMETGAESIRTVSERARAAIAGVLGVAREAFDAAGDFDDEAALAFRADGLDDSAAVFDSLSVVADQLSEALPADDAVVDEWFAA